jgi:hypothetical protein
MRFDNYLKDDDLIVKLIEVSVFYEDFNVINEAEGNVIGKINSLLGKLGLHTHASDAGIIQVLAKGGKNIAQLIWYAMKAMTGDKTAKEKVKELANKEITREQFIDFLLKLDTLTMHFITGPIHMIDALTGWHVGANIKKDSDDMITRVKKAIGHLSTVSKNLANDVKNKVQSYVENLKRIFNIEK